jgi:uncharacterized C2H2 Zn-finger protein
MVVRELKVKDYFGNEREYKLYFNMDEDEIMDFEFGRVKGGISEFYGRILRAQDIPSLISALKDVITTAYGIPTADGEMFQKSPEISRRFKYTKAYSEFMMKLYTDDAYGQAFLKELFPEEVMKKILARVEENQKKAEKNVTAFPASENLTVPPVE